MNATSVHTRAYGVASSVTISVVGISVVFSLAALLLLVIIVYMLVRTSRKRELDRPPETKNDKLRKLRLSLGLGDIQPKVKRDLVTLNTNSYDIGRGHGLWNNRVVSTPIKCHL